MNARILYLLLIGISYLPCVSAQTAVFCGRQAIYVATLKETDAAPKFEVQWQWDATQCDEIPAAYRAAFATTDECKPARKGKLLLITSSSGGCAAVEYPSGKAIWYARVPNAHSIELLPGDHIVVASSTNTHGNKLVLFHLSRMEQAIAEVPLESGHGVVWDERRQRLWALGYAELQSYAFSAGNAAETRTEAANLKLQERFTLPTAGGHDLIAPAGSDDLLLSTEGGVYWFDREQKRFRAHPVIGEREHVKSLAVHPQNHRLAFIQASETQWWSNQVELSEPQQSVPMPKHDLYKLRWFPNVEL